MNCQKGEALLTEAEWWPPQGVWPSGPRPIDKKFDRSFISPPSAQGTPWKHATVFVAEHLEVELAERRSGQAREIDRLLQLQ
jgi:hypothetical protein